MFSLIIFSIVLCLANSTPTDDPYITESTYEPVETAAPYQPPETAAPYQPLETAAPYQPLETAAPYQPLETAAPYQPLETAAPYQPMETAAPYQPLETAAPYQPLETAAPYQPMETAAPYQPLETAAPYQPLETAAPYAPLETAAPYAPLLTVASNVSLVGAPAYGPTNEPLVTDATYDEQTTSPIVNHKLTASRDERLLAEAITAKIVGPVVIFNSKVATAAGALPSLLAAKGALIGSAIATPIEIGAVAGSSLVSGVTGKLVAVPIAAVSGAKAKFIDAAERGQHIWDFNKEHGKEILKDGFIKVGHIILKPIAVVVGAHTAFTGAGLGIAGSGIKGFGVGMEKVGGKMFATGLLAKGLGHKLIKAQFVP